MYFEYSWVCCGYTHSSFRLYKAQKSLVVPFLLSDKETDGNFLQIWGSQIMHAYNYRLNSMLSEKERGPSLPLRDSLCQGQYIEEHVLGLRVSWDIYLLFLHRSLPVLAV